MYGHFAPDRYEHRTAQAVSHELALNPDGFAARTDTEILSTLVHEQTHVEQQVFGKPGRRGYHNRAWGDLMRAVGLAPSATGEPGGKETGERVTHYVIPGGPFARACAALLASGFALDWQSRQGPALAPAGGDDDEDPPKKKTKARVKLTCPDCALNAWAQPGSALLCGRCHARDGGAVVAMVPAV